MDLKLQEQLTPDEWLDFQNSMSNLVSAGNRAYDGYIEHDINTRDGELCISFWPKDVNSFIDTRKEFNQCMTMESGQAISEGSMQSMAL